MARIQHKTIWLIFGPLVHDAKFFSWLGLSLLGGDLLMGSVKFEAGRFLFVRAEHVGYIEFHF